MIYKLKLTPVGNYFFGTERSFGDGSGSNYLVKSKLMPQQTTILGMLRYEMLRHNNQIPINNPEDAISIAGEHSFDSKKPQDFGNIIRLSPLFLQAANDIFYISSRNKQVYFDDVSKKYIPQNLNFQTSTQKAFSFKLNQTNEVETVERMKPVLQDFDLKTIYEDYFIGFGSPKELLMKDVFTEHSQIGITKSYDSGAKNKAFFKKTSYNLKKGLSFVCWVELKEPINWTNELVFMGAERSTFLLEVGQPETEWYDKKLNIQQTSGTKVVLLSDAYVNPTIYEGCDFALTNLEDFRNIISSVRTGNFRKQLPKINQKHHLLKKGSILYANDLVKVKDALKNDAFQQIGYNAYMIY